MLNNPQSPDESVATIDGVCDSADGIVVGSGVATVAVSDGSEGVIGGVVWFITEGVRL